MKKPSICLNMIVKNENHIIQQTLENILANVPIDYWVISDTGSTDGTQESIKSFFASRNIPGELHQEEWKNFAFNRNSALRHCDGKSDYVLIFDADDRFEGNFKLPENLTEEAYYFRLRRGTIHYRVLLFKNRPQYHWRGVLHEFLELGNIQKSHIPEENYCVISGAFGARSQDPQKYYKDALVFEHALSQPEDEDLKPRYAFYCAQSYKDAEMYEKAIEWYQKRIEMGGWIEEVTCAYEALGIAFDCLGKKQEALNTWLMGYDYNPSRLECLYNAVRLLRIQNNCRLGYQLAKVGVAIPYPKNDVLFVKRDVYHVLIHYELSICAYYVNDFKQGYESCRDVLFLEPNEVIAETTINNLRFYKEFAKEDKPENVAKLVQILQTYLAHNENEQANNTLAYLLEVK